MFKIAVCLITAFIFAIDCKQSPKKWLQHKRNNIEKSQVPTRRHAVVPKHPENSLNNTKRWLESSYNQGYQSNYGDMGRFENPSSYEAKQRSDTYSNLPSRSDIEAYLKPGIGDYPSDMINEEMLPSSYTSHFYRPKSEGFKNTIMNELKEGQSSHSNEPNDASLDSSFFLPGELGKAGEKVDPVGTTIQSFNSGGNQGVPGGFETASIVSDAINQDEVSPAKVIDSALTKIEDEAAKLFKETKNLQEGSGSEATSVTSSMEKSKMKEEPVTEETKIEEITSSFMKGDKDLKEATENAAEDNSTTVISDTRDMVGSGSDENIDEENKANGKDTSGGESNTKNKNLAKSTTKHVKGSRRQGNLDYIGPTTDEDSIDTSHYLKPHNNLVSNLKEQLYQNVKDVMNMGGIITPEEENESQTRHHGDVDVNEATYHGIPSMVRLHRKVSDFDNDASNKLHHSPIEIEVSHHENEADSREVGSSESEQYGEAGDKFHQKLKKKPKEESKPEEDKGNKGKSKGKKGAFKGDKGVETSNETKEGNKDKKVAYKGEEKEKSTSDEAGGEEENKDPTFKGSESSDETPAKEDEKNKDQAFNEKDDKESGGENVVSVDKEGGPKLIEGEKAKAGNNGESSGKVAGEDGKNGGDSEGDDKTDLLEENLMKIDKGKLVHLLAGFMRDRKKSQKAHKTEHIGEETTSSLLGLSVRPYLTHSTNGNDASSGTDETPRKPAIKEASGEVKSKDKPPEHDPYVDIGASDPLDGPKTARHVTNDKVEESEEDDKKKVKENTNTKDVDVGAKESKDPEKDGVSLEITEKSKKGKKLDKGKKAKSDESKKVKQSKQKENKHKLKNALVYIADLYNNMDNDVVDKILEHEKSSMNSLANKFDQQILEDDQQKGFKSKDDKSSNADNDMKTEQVSSVNKDKKVENLIHHINAKLAEKAKKAHSKSPQTDVYATIGSRRSIEKKTMRHKHRHHYRY